jgi:DHA1 family bicyclomycin/chloramphenicol resistance-like MFS transporter
MAFRFELLRLALLTALIAFAALSIDIVIPALPRIAETLSAEKSAAAAQLTFSVFVAGYAVAQLIYGPLSDRFGRRPVLVGGLIVYLAGSVACALAGSIDELIAARLLQSIGCCAGPVLARAIIRDLYGPEHSARVLAYTAAVMGVIPAVGPLLGGYLLTAFGWRSIFWSLVGFGVLSLLATIAILAESNRWKNPAALTPRNFVGNFGSLLADRNFTRYIAALAGNTAGIYCFHSLSAFVLIRQFGVAESDYGFYFLGIVVGFIAGTYGGGRLTRRYGHDRMIAYGGHVQIFAAALMAALGWLRVDAPLAVIAPMALFMFGCGFIFPNATAAAIAPHASKAGAASALVGFLQASIGVAVGSVVTLFHDGTQRAMVTGILLSVVVSGLAFRALSRPPRP